MTQMQFQTENMIFLLFYHETILIIEVFNDKLLHHSMEKIF